MTGDIESSKILIKDVFTRWFRVPEYQRPYVWGQDEVSDLLEDVTDAFQSRPSSQYFLGSIVFQTAEVRGNSGNSYSENDLLDGQQRLTTCLMLLAVARDLTDNPQLKGMCSKAVFQEQNLFEGIPERLRIVYDIRPEVRDFVKKFVKPDGGTNNVEELQDLAANFKDISVRQMSKAILQIRSYFQAEGAPVLEDFFVFFFNKVVLVYVASATLDDAFRLFTVLNNRGMKLRSSDILKTHNLRALDSQSVTEDEKGEWAKYWEDTENELGEEFDTFLAQLRTVLVKEKAKTSLLQEFEDSIYNKGLLTMGKPTFDFIRTYKDHYDVILNGNTQATYGSHEFDNLIALLQISRADFWLPPLLLYRNLYGDHRILDFTRKLENKFSADWILRATPTVRLENMNRMLRRMSEIASKSDKSQQLDELLGSKIFDFDHKSLMQRLDTDFLYGSSFVTYLLYKLDMIVGGPNNKLQPSTLR